MFLHKGLAGGILGVVSNRKLLQEFILDSIHGLRKTIKNN